MGEHRISVRWSGKRQFIGWDEQGHGVVMDVASEKGGDNAGTSPLQLVLYGLAGCTAIDIVGILEKKRQPLAGLEVVVVGRQVEQGPPTPYERIAIEYIVDGDVDAKAVDDALRLSSEKYCSVKAMFSEKVEIVTSWRYKEQKDEGVRA